MATDEEHLRVEIQRLMAQRDCIQADADALRGKLDLTQEEYLSLMAERDEARRQIDELNHEIMGYQVDDGYQKGHDHAQAAARQEVLRDRQRRTDAEADLDTLIKGLEPVSLYHEAGCKTREGPLWTCDCAASRENAYRVAPEALVVLQARG